MQIPIKIIDLEPIKKKLNMLTFNYECLKTYGNNLQVSKQVLDVFDLTIRYLKAICDNADKYESYKEHFQKMIAEKVDFNTYKAGDNVFIDNCLRIFVFTDRSIKESEQDV